VQVGLIDEKSGLSDQLRNGIPGQAEYGVRSYFESVRQATLFLRDRSVEAWYPTHFLHAWAATRVRKVAFDGLTFENDGEGRGRRRALADFLPLANFLLGDEARSFTANLASDPGDFRTPESWPLAAPRPGCALGIMNDPLQVAKQRQGDSYMDFDDFEGLGDRLAERFLERPALTVNVVFCFSNPGRADRYQVLTEMMTPVWSKAFAAGREYGCIGIKWANFLIFVAGCNTRAPWANPTFAEAFQTLVDRIRTGLNIADREADVTLYRP